MANESYNNLYITILSFGFKYGIPSDADLVFDVRFLPNPYYVDELRPKTGEDREVREYVMQNGTAAIFLDKLYDMLEFLIRATYGGKEPAGYCGWMYRREAPLGDHREGGLREAESPRGIWLKD